MPNDIAIIAPLSKVNKDPNYIRATGYTEFIFEPYENDIQFNPARQVITFSGAQKLVQSIMRIVLTTLGASYEDPLWGSELNNQIGSKLLTSNFAEVRESIISALKHYNDVNQDNPNSDEVINTIDELVVVKDNNDPRVMRVVIGVTTEAGDGVRVIVPQVIN